ncbi:MAG: hypothetical protein CSYNP_02734 [Syntrophus sp. SKADARSKE-3]|nr:hypothetical protein [Syntrophus sp. SKADARSKE-3]
MYRFYLTFFKKSLYYLNNVNVADKNYYWQQLPFREPRVD